MYFSFSLQGGVTNVRLVTIGVTVPVTTHLLLLVLLGRQSLRHSFRLYAL